MVARRDAAAVIKTANELLILSEEHGLPQTRAVALSYLGWGLGQTDDLARGLHALQDGLEIHTRLGSNRMSHDLLTGGNLLPIRSIRKSNGTDRSGDCHVRRAWRPLVLAPHSYGPRGGGGKSSNSSRYCSSAIR